MSQYAENAAADTGQQILVADTQLMAGGLTLPAAIAQSLTHVAPAAGFLLGASFIATQAGYGVSLAYVLAFLICLTLALTLVALARHLPSAGGYFTYVSRALHPRLGFLTAWLYFLYDPTVTAINLTIFGIVTENGFKEFYGITVPWWLTVALGTIFVTAIIWRGVKLSGRTLIVLAAIEVSILLLFGLWGFISPGPGGVTIKPLTIDPAFGFEGLWLGVVFAIFAFTGFEAIAPMAEETRNPRRNVPLAVIISLLLMGAFYVFTTWGLVTGWGVDRFAAGDDQFAGAPVGAFFSLAESYWGPLWILLWFALLNSIVAVSISATNACTRVWFAMGRAGALPKWLGGVNATHKTPANAIILATLVTVAFGYIGGFWVGPDTIFYWWGIVITLGLVLVYGLGALGVVRYYLTEKRPEFNVILHLVVPIVAIAGVIIVGYYSAKDLFTADWPYVTSLWVMLGWLVVGILYLVVLRSRGEEQWLEKAIEVAYERPASPEELAD